MASIAYLDNDALKADVLEYMRRWNISVFELGMAINMSRGNLYRFMAGNIKSINTDFAASLAYLCDLDLCNYIKEREIA